MKVHFGWFLCNECVILLHFRAMKLFFGTFSCNESAAMDCYLWSSEETSHRHAVSCDLARKHHIVMVMQVADICARTYCTFHHTSKYKNTCLLQFLLQLEIYGHVHTALFYRISRYKGMCLLHFSPRSDIYRHVPWHIPTALFLTFRDIWARTYCTFHHISRYI